MITLFQLLLWSLFALLKMATWFHFSENGPNMKSKILSKSSFPNESPLALNFLTWLQVAICELIAEFAWDQIYQVLLGFCWIQPHVLWWQLPIQWELMWSSKDTNPCISCARLDAIWHVTIKYQKEIWFRDYFLNVLLSPIYQVFH